MKKMKEGRNYGTKGRKVKDRMKKERTEGKE